MSQERREKLPFEPGDRPVADFGCEFSALTKFENVFILNGPVQQLALLRANPATGEFGAKTWEVLL